MQNIFFVNKTERTLPHIIDTLIHKNTSYL